MIDILLAQWLMPTMCARAVRKELQMKDSDRKPSDEWKDFPNDWYRKQEAKARASGEYDRYPIVNYGDLRRNK